MRPHNLLQMAKHGNSIGCNAEQLNEDDQRVDMADALREMHKSGVLILHASSSYESSWTIASSSLLSLGSQFMPCGSVLVMHGGGLSRYRI